MVESRRANRHGGVVPVQQRGVVGGQEILCGGGQAGDARWIGGVQRACCRPGGWAIVARQVVVSPALIARLAGNNG
jgi:hypothetical protein